MYQHPKNVRGAIKTAENILYTARTSRRSTFYTTNHYIYSKGFIHCSIIRLYSRLTDLSLKEVPCVFNIVATCLITLFDTANVIARELSYISTMPSVNLLLTQTQCFWLWSNTIWVSLWGTSSRAWAPSGTTVSWRPIWRGNWHSSSFVQHSVSCL